MTRRSGDTERRPRLNPNAQNVFFMRVESIVIWSFLFVAGMSRVRANEEADHVELREEERRGRRMDALVDGWIIGKINDSSELIGGSSWNSMWEEDKVEDGSRERKTKRETEVRLKANLKMLNLQFGIILGQYTLLAVEI